MHMLMHMLNRFKMSLTGDNIKVEGDKNVIKTPEKKSILDYIKSVWSFIKGLFKGGT